MRCKKCLNTDKIRHVKIEAGICNICKEEPYAVQEEQRQRMRGEFEETIKQLKQHPGPHNCVVAFSGGKDSTYLLYLLKYTYGLNPIAVTVDTGFMSPYAVNNIHRVVQKMAVPHQFLRPEASLFTTIYRYMLTTKDRQVHLLFDNCNLCTLVMDICMSLFAVEKNIPILFSGETEDEIQIGAVTLGREMVVNKDDLIYELKAAFFTEVLKTHKELFKKIDPCLSNLVNSYMALNQKPRLLWPLHVLDYEPERIRRFLARKKLLPKKRSSSFKTNCAINTLLIYKFTKTRGYNPYLELMSDIVRMNSRLRLRYLIFDTLLGFMIKTDIFRKKSIDKLLHQLQLQRSDIL